MALLDFFKGSENNKNVIYILDRLLQIAINGDAINKSKKIDLGLYKILNSPKMNQEIIHVGLLPIVRENGKASEEFVHFVNNLWIYMEYDINTDFLWAKTTDSPNTQRNIYERIVSIRKEILQYLLNKKLISDETYTSELNYKIKNLMNE
ncbi:MAG: hypothetical protein WC587_02140 [Candidatus Paceibacterota bacterium]